MKEEFLRLGLIIGEQKLEQLSEKHVAVFGIGGVGSFAVEALVRSNLGEITIIDYDYIDRSNINRQIPALQENIGKVKVEVLAERIRGINPDIKINALAYRYNPDNADSFFERKYDYIIDAIDIITSKLDLIVNATKRGIPIISSMGMGNKMDPTRIKLADINDTYMCPMARVMRKELKARGVKNLLTVFSDEKPVSPIWTISTPTKRVVNGSSAFVPSVGGLIIASKVVRDLIQYE